MPQTLDKKLRMLHTATRFSPSLLIKSVFVASGIAILLGLPAHLASFAIRHKYADYSTEYLLQRMRGIFENPQTRMRFFGIHSPIDALEWMLIAIVGALCGVCFYWNARRRGEKELAFLAKQTSTESVEEPDTGNA